MRGVVILGGRKLEFQDFPDPEPGPGEVVIEIKASGMCGSDLKFYRIVGGAQALGLGGDGSPVIGGHEPCGVVAEVGAGVDPSATAAKGSRLSTNDGRWRVLRPGQDRKAFADDVVPSRACFAGA